MVTIDDVLAASYRVAEPPPPMAAANTALLLVDIQHLATPEHLAAQAVAAGLSPEEVETVLADYATRFYAATENGARLLHAARQAGVTCVHVKIEAMAGDARDTGAAHRRLGWRYPPGSPATQFLDAVRPLPEEIVVTKTVSGAFTATNLDSVLRHMGVQWLIVAGFETDECIEATGRAALDLGYLALFAEDACTAYKAEAHDVFMGKYASWGLTRTTDHLVAALSGLRER